MVFWCWLILPGTIKPEFKKNYKNSKHSGISHPAASSINVKIPIFATHTVKSFNTLLYAVLNTNTIYILSLTGHADVEKWSILSERDFLVLFHLDLIWAWLSPCLQEVNVEDPVSTSRWVLMLQALWKMQLTTVSCCEVCTAIQCGHIFIRSGPLNIPLIDNVNTLWV